VHWRCLYKQSCHCSSSRGLVFQPCDSTACSPPLPSWHVWKFYWRRISGAYFAVGLPWLRCAQELSSLRIISMQSDACFDCPAGQWCMAASTTTFSSSSRGTCPAGYYCPLSTQHPVQYPCPGGYYNNQTGSVSNASCLTCPAVCITIAPCMSYSKAAYLTKLLCRVLSATQVRPITFPTDAQLDTTALPTPVTHGGILARLDTFRRLSLRSPSAIVRRLRTSVQREGIAPLAAPAMACPAPWAHTIRI
jgi:hypothetical protein